MQRAKIAGRKRSNAWKWALTIVIGVAMGIAGGTALKMLQKSNTSPLAFFRPPFGGHKFIRILVLGEDNTNKLRTTGRGLSDTIMVAAIDLNNNTVRGVSVPRDAEIELPGFGTRKINAAYALGGPDLTTQAVQQVLGVSVDYYIKTDISKLKDIVDLVGGVGIDIEKNMRYTDRRGGLRIDLKKGYRRLDGDKALQYVRFRHDAMGDIWRTERQQKFLRALSRQMLLPGNWAKLPSIVGEIYEKHYVETNLDAKDLLALAKLARDVPQEKMVMETLPGAPERLGRGSYWVLDKEKTAEIVQRLLEFNNPAEGLAKVQVLNGSGIYGLAKEVADQLERSGYKITETGNAPRFDYASSQIIVHNPKADNAEEIAKLIRCTDIKTETTEQVADGAADITVIVGKDYRQ